MRVIPANRHPTLTLISRFPRPETRGITHKRPRSRDEYLAYIYTYFFLTTASFFQENLLTDPAAPPLEVENPQVFSPSPSFVCPSSTSLSPSGAGRRETPKLIAPPGGSDVTVASLNKEAVRGQRGGGGRVTRRLQVVRQRTSSSRRSQGYGGGNGTRRQVRNRNLISRGGTRSRGWLWSS